MLQHGRDARTLASCAAAAGLRLLRGACAGALARRLPAFLRMLNGRARILIGASGELILAGEEHWLAGRVLPPGLRR